jgi:hypothetical protein
MGRLFTTMGVMAIAVSAVLFSAGEAKAGDDVHCTGSYSACNGYCICDYCVCYPTQTFGCTCGRFIA